jgi:hypothetical protein
MAPTLVPLLLVVEAEDAAAGLATAVMVAGVLPWPSLGGLDAVGDAVMGADC